MTLEAHLKSGSIACTVLDGIMTVGLHGPHIVADHTGHVLSHGLPSTTSMHHAIEMCSGIGGLGEGLEHNS